jgi:hypothetical protein
MISSEREQQIDRKIALSNIAWIEVENVNWLNTSLPILGIAVTAFVAFFYFGEVGYK